MFHRINLQNPVNWSHPLNIGRMAWWFIPPDSGWVPSVATGAVSTGPVLRDLCGRFHGTVENGASNIPQPAVMPSGDQCLKWGSGGGVDGQVNVGGASQFNFTDNFTVGCSFVTDTLTPSGIGGLAGLLNKYNSPAANEWTFRQHDAKLEFGGSTLLATGSILATNTQYRAIAVMRNGTAYIYVNGLLITSGAVSITSGSNVVYIGEAYEPSGGNFRGRINDAFIAARPWSDLDVLMDYKCSIRGYRVENSPLRFLDSRQYLTADGALGPAEFTNSATDTNLPVFANIASFTCSAGATGDAGGIGTTVPSGPADFENVSLDREIALGGIPTLVSIEVRATDSETIVGGSPAYFTVSANARQSLLSIPNGDRRILSQGRYRR